MAVAPGGADGEGIALVAEPRLEHRDARRPGHLAGRARRCRWATEPVAIAVSTAASGSATAFVADFGSNTVTPIDVATHAGGSRHRGRARAADARGGGRVRSLVGNFGNHTLTPINASDPAPRDAPVPLPAEPDRHRRRALG